MNLQREIEKELEREFFSEAEEATHHVFITHWNKEGEVELCRNCGQRKWAGLANECNRGLLKQARAKILLKQLFIKVFDDIRNVSESVWYGEAKETLEENINLIVDDIIDAAIETAIERMAPYIVQGPFTINLDYRECAEEE